MSLHAKPTEEALHRLRAQRRNSTISAAVIAVLTIVLIGLGLGFFLLPALTKEEPVMVIYPPSPNPNAEKERPTVPVNVSRKPSAPSPSAARVMVSNVMSQVSIPVPETEVAMPSMDFGNGSDFGDGWNPSADGGTGGGSIFGSTSAIPGALKGRLFDFKQNRGGKAISYDPAVENFASLARTAERRNFQPDAFSKYFVAPHELHLTNLAIPFTPAERGPEYFGANDSIKPSGWLAVYSGQIAAPVSGKYRFRGAADDYLVVLINGRRHLVSCWPSLHETVAGRWKSGEMQGSPQSPLGSARLHAGDWLDLKAGEPVDIAIGIGERPGGMVGFLLEVEQQGISHRSAPNGRKILPLFTTTPFTDTDRQEIQGRFKDYEFEWENVPVFGSR